MRRLLAIALMVLGLWRNVGAAPIPVIYSTDLMHPHDDPDDHFDLACLYAIPEADLRAIILDQGEQQSTRAGFKPVWQLNYLTGRHVPAAIGLRDPLRSPSDAGLDQPSEYQNGVNLILQTLHDSRQKACLVFVGSARDVTAAYNRRPDLFRDKVRSIYGFIGEAADATHQEWNVKLDPHAFVGLVRANLPFHWIPCFDGGPWKNNGHASFWQIRQRDVLANSPLPLQQYFSYMLRKNTNNPIECLSMPLSPDDHNQLMETTRNMWCGALLGLAVERHVHAGRKPVTRFTDVKVSVDPTGLVTLPKPGVPVLRVKRFEITDRHAYSNAVTVATRHLLESFPVREGFDQRKPVSPSTRNRP